MKFTYPAIIRKTGAGNYRATFPDLECCEAQGDTVEEAVERANEAAFDWISLELSEDDGQLPGVTDVRDIVLMTGEEVRNICVNIRLMEGWDE